MSKHTHIVGEGEAAIGVVASPLQSGRRLGLLAGISKELPMQDNCSADVGSSSLFLGIEHSEMNPARQGHYLRVPSAVPAIEIRPLSAANRIGVRTCVVRILPAASGPEIARPIVRRVAIYVIDTLRNLAKGFAAVKGEHNPMSANINTGEDDAYVASRLSLVAGFFRSTASVP